MTRKFLDDLRTEIVAAFPDNTAGLITPAALRVVAEDTVDSLAIDESTIFRQAASGSTTLAVGITPTDIVAVADANITDANMDNTAADEANGRWTSGDVGGRSYRIQAHASVELGNNMTFILGFSINGTPAPFQSFTSGRGAADPISLSLNAPLDAVPASATIQMFCITPDGAETVTFQAFAAEYIILPTNNP